MGITAFCGCCGSCWRLHGRRHPSFPSPKENCGPCYALLQSPPAIFSGGGWRAFVRHQSLTQRVGDVAASTASSPTPSLSCSSPSYLSPHPQNLHHSSMVTLTMFSSTVAVPGPMMLDPAWAVDPSAVQQTHFTTLL